MNIRLKTKDSIEKIIIELQSFLQLSSKAAIIRIAVSYSIKLGTDPRNEKNYTGYNILNQDGSDYLRLTVLGQDDLLYRIMMQQAIKSNISDNDFFPELLNAHLERGLPLLLNNYRICASKERLISELIK